MTGDASLGLLPEFDEDFSFENSVCKLGNNFDGIILMLINDVETNYSNEKESSTFCSFSPAWYEKCDNNALIQFPGACACRFKHFFW